MPEELRYFVGLDLGQTRDPSALSVLERRTEVPASTGVRIVTSAAMGLQVESPANPPRPREPRARKAHSYSIRHLERYELMTPYPAIVEAVMSLFERPPLTGEVLVVDQTGVGRPVVEMFLAAAAHGTAPSEEWARRHLHAAGMDTSEDSVRRVMAGRRKLKARVVPVTITSGSASSSSADGFRVPKKELVAALSVLMQARNLRVAEGLPLSGELVKEMRNFQYKITPHANETMEAWREGDRDDIVLATALSVWYATRANREFWMR